MEILNIFIYCEINFVEQFEIKFHVAKNGNKLRFQNKINWCVIVDLYRKLPQKVTGDSITILINEHKFA